MKTRTISYQNILSDASNLSYFAGMLLKETNVKLKQAATLSEQSTLIEDCNISILQTYIFNLKMLYPGLRIVCQDVERDKDQVNLISKLQPSNLPI